MRSKPQPFRTYCFLTSAEEVRRLPGVVGDYGLHPELAGRRAQQPLFRVRTRVVPQQRHAAWAADLRAQQHPVAVDRHAPVVVAGRVRGRTGVIEPLAAGQKICSEPHGPAACRYRAPASRQASMSPRSGLFGPRGGVSAAGVLPLIGTSWRKALAHAGLLHDSPRFRLPRGSISLSRAAVRMLWCAAVCGCERARSGGAFRMRLGLSAMIGVLEGGGSCQREDQRLWLIRETMHTLGHKVSPPGQPRLGRLSG